MKWRTPEYDGAARTCRPVFIPTDLEWLAVVGGALAELTKPHNWQQVGITPERASEIASELLRLFYEGECTGSVTVIDDVRQSGSAPCILEKRLNGVWEPFANLRLCAPMVRISADGRTIEFSTDAGETWESASPPVPPVVGGATSSDKRCIAASSAAEVIDLTLAQINDAWAGGINALVIAAGLISFFATLFFFAPAAPLVATFITELYGLLDALGGLASLSAQTRDELVCMLYCRSSVDGGVVTFDFNGLLEDVDAKTELPLSDWFAVEYLLHLVGEDALNRAGATGVNQSAVCDCAECPEEWCYEFDFTIGAHGFTGYPNSQYMTQVGGSGLRSGSFPNGTNVYTQIVHAVRQFNGLPVKRIEFDLSISINAPNGNYWIRNDAVNLVLAPKSGGDKTYVWEGAVNLQTLGFGANNYNTTSANHHYIRRLRLYGDGENPFGENNCEPL